MEEYLRNLTDLSTDTLKELRVQLVGTDAESKTDADYFAACFKTSTEEYLKASNYRWVGFTLVRSEFCKSTVVLIDAELERRSK